LIELVRSARDRAKDALAFTPEQLPVLKQAGVVDSGGTGLLLLYDALCSVVAHDPLPIAPSAESIVVHVHEDAESRESTVADLRYEVMYFLDAEDDKMHAFREVWSGIGDSIVIVAATASTTVTFTPTTSAPPSRPRWTPDVRATFV